MRCTCLVTIFMLASRASHENVGDVSEVTDVVRLDGFEARMEVSATVDGFLQPSKPHLHSPSWRPPPSCHPVLPIIITAAKKVFLVKISTFFVILVIGCGNVETILGLRKSAYYTRDGVGSRSSHPSLVLGLPGEIVEDATADKANHNLVPSLSVPLTPTQ